MPPKHRRDSVTRSGANYNHGSEDEENNPHDEQVIENPLHLGESEKKSKEKEKLD